MSEIPTSLAFGFDRASLRAVADRYRDAYAVAEPFPHAVIDGLIPDGVLDAVADEFPDPQAADWQEFSRRTEVKLALADPEQMGPQARHLLAELNGQVFVEFLSELTGIDRLITDHTLAGGGLHQIRPGGFLGVHADFNRHDGLGLDRRLNALLYLNRDWDESYGGNLELWDRDMRRAVISVPPVFNRLVVFSTTDTAFHGHPDPLTCPPERCRRSLALYYYTNGRPGEGAARRHSTLFQSRPGERKHVSVREVARQWTPPAVVDLVRRLRNRPVA